MASCRVIKISFVEKECGAIDIDKPILPLLPKKGLTVPGYKFCGPDNLINSEKTTNKFDVICMKHDNCYSNDIPKRQKEMWFRIAERQFICLMGILRLPSTAMHKCKFDIIHICAQNPLLNGLLQNSHTFTLVTQDPVWTGFSMKAAVDQIVVYFSC